MLANSADGIGADAKRLLLAARAYHLADRSVAKEIEIKMDLQDMSVRASALSMLSSDEANLGACRASIAALRRAITGKHFEDEHLGPLADGDVQLQSIAADTLRVQQAFLKLKHLQFPV